MSRESGQHLGDGYNEQQNDDGQGASSSIVLIGQSNCENMNVQRSCRDIVPEKGVNLVVDFHQVDKPHQDNYIHDRFQQG